MAPENTMHVEEGTQLQSHQAGTPENYDSIYGTYKGTVNGSCISGSGDVVEEEDRKIVRARISGNLLWFLLETATGLGQKSGSIDGNVKKAGAGAGGLLSLNKELHVPNDCWEAKT